MLLLFWSLVLSMDFVVFDFLCFPCECFMCKCLFLVIFGRHFVISLLTLFFSLLKKVLYMAKVRFLDEFMRRKF